VSQRASGYVRRRLDLYQTPGWVIGEGLHPFFPVTGLDVCEPCAGPGKMVRTLEALGARVFPSDRVNYARHYARRRLSAPLFRQIDFLERPHGSCAGVDAWVINPPYGPEGTTAEAFISRGLELLRAAPEYKRGAFLAVLLPVDFDSASSRAHLFELNRNFHARIILRRRIEWFKRPKGKSGPSQNHCWFIWCAEERAPGVQPIVFYAPAARVRQRALAYAHDTGIATSAIKHLIASTTGERNGR